MFIKRCNIGENILNVYSLIAAAEDNDESDILVFLDIEKAYDTVNWRFLSTILLKLGFPDSFVRWVEILHRNKEIRFYNNGYSSKPLFPSKGLAQGCGLSPLLFIIAMSHLAEVLNREPHLEGINCAGIEKKCCLAADDTVIGLKAEKKNMRMLIRVLNAFYVTSSLKVNYNKSVIVRIGKWKRSHHELQVDNDFVWSKPGEMIKYLGIFMSPLYNPDDPCIELLFSVNEFLNDTLNLRYQHLSIIGRILVLKSLVSSKLVYKFLHYPTPMDKIFKHINQMFYKFVWEGTHHINAKQMIQPIGKRGFNMLNVVFQQQSLQFHWLSKTLHNANEKAIWEHYL